MKSDQGNENNENTNRLVLRACDSASIIIIIIIMLPAWVSCSSSHCVGHLFPRNPRTTLYRNIRNWITYQCKTIFIVRIEVVRVKIIRQTCVRSGTGTPGTGMDIPKCTGCRERVLMSHRTYRSVRYRYWCHTELTEVSGTCIDVISNLPKCPVPVIPAVRLGTYRSEHTLDKLG